MKLSSSTVRVSKYAQGGILLALAISTLNAQGQNNLKVTRVADAENEGEEKIDALELIVGASIHRQEFEDDQAFYSDSTQFGANTYPKHSIGVKFAGKSGKLDKLAKICDLSRTTWLVKTRFGDWVLVGGDNGLRNEKNDSGSGTAPGDFNGLDMVLSGAETRKAEIVPKQVAEALLAQIDTVKAPAGV